MNIGYFFSKVFYSCHDTLGNQDMIVYHNWSLFQSIGSSGKGQIQAVLPDDELTEINVYQAKSIYLKYKVDTRTGLY